MPKCKFKKASVIKFNLTSIHKQQIYNEKQLTKASFYNILANVKTANNYTIYAPVAQLDRALVYGRQGAGFEYSPKKILKKN